MWLLIGGAVVVLLLAGIITAAVALNGGGSEGTASSGGGEGGDLTGRPTLEAPMKDGYVQFTMEYDGFTEGDGFAIQYAPTRDNFGPSTVYSVPEVKEGKGVYPLPLREGTQQCGRVQVVRDAETPEEQRSEWSEVACATGEGS